MSSIRASVISSSMQRIAKRNSSRSMLPPPSASKKEKMVLYCAIRSLLTPYLLCSSASCAPCSFSVLCISAADSMEVVITPMKSDIITSEASRMKETKYSETTWPPSCSTEPMVTLLHMCATHDETEPGSYPYLEQPYMLIYMTSVQSSIVLMRKRVTYDCTRGKGWG